MAGFRRAPVSRSSLPGLPGSCPQPSLAPLCLDAEPVPLCPVSVTFSTPATATYLKANPVLAPPVCPEKFSPFFSLFRAKS